MKKTLLFILYLLSSMIAVYLLVINLRYTSLVYSTTYPIYDETSYFSFLLMIPISILILLLVIFVNRINSKRILWTIFILMNIIGLFSKLVYSTSFNNSLMADCWNVIDSANKLLIQDPSITWSGSYLSTYQNQISLALLYSPLAMLFRYHSEHYYLVQAFFIQLSILFITLAIYRKSDLKKAIFVNFLLLMFLPNTWMVYFVYGDVPALFFLSISFLLYTFVNGKLNPSQITLYIFIYLFLALSYLLRTVVGIFIIALAISILFSKLTIKRKTVFSLITVTILFLPIKVSETTYQEITDTSLNSYSLPANSYLRIGLSYNTWSNIPGFYDIKVAQDFANVYYSNSDMKKVNDIAINERIESLSNFRSLIDFMNLKFIYLSTDPDFETISNIYPMSLENELDLSINSDSAIYGSGAYDVHSTNDIGQAIQDSFWNIRLFEKAYYLILISLLSFNFINIKSKNEFTLQRIFLIGLFLYFALFEIKSRYLWLFINFLIIFLGCIEFDRLSNYFRRTK